MWRLTTLLLLPAAICAPTLSSESSQSSIIPTPTRSQTQLSNDQIKPSSSRSSIPSSRTTSPSNSLHLWDPISSAADHVLDEISEHLHIDLRKRQGGAPITAPPAVAPTSATQLSPTTTYQAYNSVGAQVNVVYIQTFPAVNDQWPSPSAGNIGLGTIQGQVGATKSKRDAETQPTPAPDHVLRIKGREVTKS